jgi:hypothetical protein
MFRENLPNFSIWYVKPWFSSNFGAGFVHLPNKFSIEYRHKPSFKLLYLRSAVFDRQFAWPKRQSRWQTVQLVRNRRRKSLTLLECPYCCAAIEQIWATGPNKGDWRCKHCIEIPSGHRISPHISRFRKAIRNDQLDVVMKGLQAGGMQTLDARLAMEAEGLSPRQLLVEASTRINQEKFAKYLERHRSRHRLRCRIARGRLLYVEGQLHVR